MMLALVLAAAAGAQADPPAGPGPLGRFVICPGSPRCPPRASRQTLAHGGSVEPDTYGRTANPGLSFIAPPAHGGSDPGNALLFTTGDAGLNAEARELLDETAMRMRSGDRYEVLLEGHTDTSGIEAANVALAGQRAAAAAAYLVARGVAADRILTISWGEAEQASVEEPRSVVVTLRRRP